MLLKVDTVVGGISFPLGELISFDFAESSLSLEEDIFTVLFLFTFLRKATVFRNKMVGFLESKPHNRNCLITIIVIDVYML